MEEDYVDRFLAEWRVSQRPLEAGDMAAMLRLVRIGALLDREVQAIAAAANLKLGQFNILSALRRLDPKPLSPKDLIEATLLTSGAVTPVLDRLQAAGLVQRLADPDDRRGVPVRLTDKGRKRIDMALDRRMERHREVATALTPPEREKLSALARKVLLALQAPSGRSVEDG